MRLSGSIVLVACALSLACGVVSSVEIVAEGRKEAKRSTDDDFEEMLETLQKKLPKYDGEQKSSDADRVYRAQDDVFVDVRWRPVYADETESRDGRGMNSLTEAQKKSIVDLHNKLRRQEGSANMEILRYNEKLAALGQTWSQHCRFEHGQPSFDHGHIGHKDLGQNIYAHTNPAFTVEEAVNAWYDEKKDYNYNSKSCAAGKVCGHYTAVTWAKTTDVGCGITHCPSISGMSNAHYIVCNYAPAGNFQGEDPFVKGASCSKCDSGKFFCNDNLCDVSCSSAGGNCQCKADCKKCSKKDDAGCKCTCRPGTTGPDCSGECKDLDNQCGANPGYPDMLCGFNDPQWAFVKDKCPKMCKKCSPPDGSPCNQREGTDEPSKINNLKRLMLGYLEKEEREGRLNDK